MHAENLKDWTILRNVDTSSFRKVFVFDNRAIILKNNGVIYGIGKNSHYLIGTSNESHHYSNLVEISGKKFKDITTNGEHVLAIDEDGFLYSWGSYENGQLGRDGICNVVSPVLKVFAVRIKEAACGTGFSCVLTEDGKVFEWGMYGLNELVLESNNELDQKEKEEEKEEVVSIQGSKHYVMILTKSGKVYIPSFKRTINKCDRGLHVEKVKPFEGPMKNKKIKQVLSGKSYVFALTADGELFHWAFLPVNSCSCHGKAEPKRIAENIGSIAKIWAATSIDVLVAANSFGSLYSITWSGPGVLLSISQINCSSPGKYFANLDILVQGPICDLRNKECNLEENADILQEWRGRFEAAFNNKEGSDISFIVGEGIIYGHRTILSVQSSFLNAILQNDWKENSENKQVTIKEYTYSTYLRFMRFLYTGKLEMSNHESNLELLKLAHEYVEKPLLLLCKNMVIQGLTAENAFSTYNLASLLGLEDVRQACKNLIGRNLEDVVLSENISYQEEALLLKCMKDMVCSKNIVGKDEKQ